MATKGAAQISHSFQNPFGPPTPQRILTPRPIVFLCNPLSAKRKGKENKGSDILGVSFSLLFLADVLWVGVEMSPNPSGPVPVTLANGAEEPVDDRHRRECSSLFLKL